MFTRLGFYYIGACCLRFDGWLFANCWWRVWVRQLCVDGFVDLSCWLGLAFFFLVIY